MKALLYNALLIVNGNTAGYFLPIALKCSIILLEDDAQKEKL